jgi:hypothetical protein
MEAARIMPALEDKRLEALAQALARGEAVHAATREAGYSRQTGISRRRAELPVVSMRIEEIEREKWEASIDLTPVIDKLMFLVDQAGKQGTAAALVAARGLLADVASLKARRAAEAAAATGPFQAVQLPPILTKEEWLKAFAPNGGQD